MKKINTLVFAALLVFAAACSSDDDTVNQTCNCQKVIATYNEEQQVFEPIESEYYSDNCEDRQDTYNVNPEQEGTYYVIKCTPNP